MITAVLIFLILLVVLGYIDFPSFPVRDMSLFDLFGKTISLYDLVVFLIILWIIDLLPWPFRGLATVILVLWLLTFFGIIAVTGFSNILLIALVLGIVAYLFQGIRT